MKQPASIILERQITRADGTVEPAEEVAAYFRNPFKRLLWRLRHPGAGRVKTCA